MSVIEGRRACFPAKRTVTWEPVTLAPSLLKPTEMLIQTQYTLISAAAEVGLYSGEDWNEDVRYPRYPGYTNIGVVTHAGPEAEGVAVGDLVFSYAHHSTHVRLDVKRDFYLRIPDTLDPKHALFVRLGAVAMTAPTLASYKPGDWVLVFGQGLVGNLTAQLFNLSGTSVIAVDLWDSRLNVSRQCGIPYTVNSQKAHLANSVRTLTGGRGVEIVIDAVGDADCVIEGLDLLRRGGQVLLLGVIRQVSEMPASDLIRKIFLKWATVKSSWEWQLPQRESDQVQTSIESNSRDVLRLIQDGRIRVAPLISHIITPDEIQGAYEGLLNRKDDYWGVVIDWTKGKTP
jgi:2-desacetyl-2-hydroxyethyl bacteriochlorophyllide A dehydrogenase